MQVIEVKQTDIINDIPNNVIVFNKETQSYFKKDQSVILTDNLTFRDAILNEYASWARFREKELESDFIKYYDTNDKEKILNVFNEDDKIIALAEARKLEFDTTHIYSNINDDIKNIFEQNRLIIDDLYLTQFNKVIYVDQTIGLDTNGGSIDYPVKTIRRAESMIIEKTAIVLMHGIYDITKGNTRSNKRYCISGLASNIDSNNNILSVEYINIGAIGDVILMVDTDGLDYESRDLSFVNGIMNENSKAIGIIFKMLDKNKESNYSVSIVRNSEGFQLIDCVCDLDVMNGSVVYNKTENIISVKFINTIINYKKALNGEQYDRPYRGIYELENSFINNDLKIKIDTYDSKPMDINGNVSMLQNLNLRNF